MSIPTTLRRLAFALLAAAVVVLLVDARAASAAGAERIDQGVAQTVSPSSLTLRRLDGATVVVAIGTGTAVRVNGRASTIGAVAPGFVVRAFHEEGSAARLVQALGAVAARTEEGVIASVTLRRLVLRTPSGDVVVRLGPRTVVQRPSGRIAGRFALRPGTTARVTHIPGAAAGLVVVSRG